jgi:hypothetical protein
MMESLAVALQDPDLAVQGRVRKRGGEYELTLVGRGKSLEDGATVGLRFHPVARRLSWEDRSIEVFTPSEAAAGRAVEVKKGAFAHVERFAAPGTVEVRILIERDGKPALDPIVRTFRLAPAAEVAEAIESDLAALDRAGEALLVLLEEGEGILDAPCGAGRRGREYRAKVERRVAGWREAMSKSALPAAAEAFTRLIGDVETSVHSPCVRPLSSLSGRPFHLEEVSSYLEGIREAMGREARVAVAGEIEAIRAEVVGLARAGDSRAWDRAEGGIRKSLEALRGFLAGREWASEKFVELLDQTSELVQMAASAVSCPGSVGLELEERQEAVGCAIRAFEQEIAGPR